MEKVILIAIPTIEYIESATFETVYDLTVPPGYITSFRTFRGYGIDHVRNVIAKYVLDQSFDYVLFVDSDILLPRDTLTKLLSHPFPVVSGSYAKKQSGAKVLEIQGLGCTLIRRDVFEQIPAPQFSYSFSLLPHQIVSEDQMFFAQLTQLNIPFHVDTSIRCGHVGKTVY